MILYSKEPLNSTQTYLIMLDLEDDLGYLYVTRNTYDQALLLSDRFNYDIDLVIKKLGCPEIQEDVVSYMKAILPSPLNSLAPFYHLVDKDVSMDTNDIKQLIGVLSYLSMNLDFNMMLKVPFEVRANLYFSKSILMAYQDLYDDYNLKLGIDKKYSEVVEGDDTETVVNPPREQKVDFKLEEDEEEPLFDLEAFKRDSGWNDIEIPSLTVVSDDLNKTTTSKTTTPVKENTESNEYETIINRFIFTKKGE